MIVRHSQLIEDKFKECGMYNALDGSENHKVKVRGLGNLYCVDGTEEEGSLETFLKTKADKHTSRGKRPSGLNEDTSDSNTESDDDGDVNADSECDEDTDSGDSSTDSSTDGSSESGSNGANSANDSD